MTIEQLNKRVTYEWDALMKKYGQFYDEMSDEGKKAACDLAEKQGDRSAEFWRGLVRL